MQPKKTEKRLCIIVSINSHLPPHVCVFEFLCTRVSACVCVCVNKIPANKVQWPGTDENPLGESLLDVDPPPHSRFPSSFSTIFPSWHQSTMAMRAGVGGGRTEPCEWGDEQICGPLCQPQTRIREIVWNSLLGWAKGRREKTAVKCFSLTSSPAHLCFSLLCHFL